MGERPLEGQSAIVTAGGGTLGSATATWLAHDGAAVVIMGRTEATLVAAEERIRQGAGASTVVARFVGDALDPAQLAAAVAEAEGLTGRLGVAVSVVGGGGAMKPLIMFEGEEFMTVLQRNLLSAFLVIRVVTPAMVRAGGGSIVCISSTVAKIAFPYLGPYNASKAGLEALIRTAALELAHNRIRVNVVRPGLTRSNSNYRNFEDEASLAAFLAEKPLGRTGDPNDIAAGVRYLAGPDSSWVTGQSFAIDGGNELTKAPDLEPALRATYGDAAIDAALAGQLPPSPGA